MKPTIHPVITRTDAIIAGLERAIARERRLSPAEQIARNHKRQAQTDKLWADVFMGRAKVHGPRYY